MATTQTELLEQRKEDVKKRLASIYGKHIDAFVDEQKIKARWKGFRSINLDVALQKLGPDQKPADNQRYAVTNKSERLAEQYQKQQLDGKDLNLEVSNSVEGSITQLLRYDWGRNKHIPEQKDIRQIKEEEKIKNQDVQQSGVNFSDTPQLSPMRWTDERIQYNQPQRIFDQIIDSAKKCANHQIKTDRYCYSSFSPQLVYDPIPLPYWILESRQMKNDNIEQQEGSQLIQSKSKSDINKDDDNNKNNNKDDDKLNQQMELRLIRPKNWKQVMIRRGWMQNDGSVPPSKRSYSSESNKILIYGNELQRQGDSTRLDNKQKYGTSISNVNQRRQRPSTAGSYLGREQTTPIIIIIFFTISFLIILIIN
ncbi:MAG: hypothetical protein EZS28_015427 [Streblomastix strix]|uniref:Uncharacterized protein n=1 Tax=Streblomastix strix TaxID=222440 RepID=A0A5J4W3A1_9EUKA|nr:MAG: hypothetical protein EZS28_015427 [Streblomastix strix]